MQEEPDLTGDLFDIWSAFWHLNSSRPVVFTIGAIPFSEIAGYASLFEVADKELFVYCIREMDTVYLEDYRQKNPPPATK